MRGSKEGVAAALREMREVTNPHPSPNPNPNPTPNQVRAAVDAQAAEVRRLKDEEGLGNKDPQVAAAVAELLRLKALLPPEESA